MSHVDRTHESGEKLLNEGSKCMCMERNAIISLARSVRLDSDVALELIHDTSADIPRRSIVLRTNW